MSRTPPPDLWRFADCDEAVGQEINIATGREISIGELADELIRQINPAAKVVCEEQRLRPAKSEVERLLGDATKLRLDDRMGAEIHL